MAVKTIKKTFPAADKDGINTRYFRPGDEVPDWLPADVLQGLEDEGYVTSATTEGEAHSKLAGTASLAAAAADSPGVAADAARASAGISDGLVGGPEASTIIDAHKPFNPDLPVSEAEAKDSVEPIKAGQTENEAKAEAEKTAAAKPAAKK